MRRKRRSNPLWQGKKSTVRDQTFDAVLCWFKMAAPRRLTEHPGRPCRLQRSPPNQRANVPNRVINCRTVRPDRRHASTVSATCARLLFHLTWSTAGHMLCFFLVHAAFPDQSHPRLIPASTRGSLPPSTRCHCACGLAPPKKSRPAYDRNVVTEGVDAAGVVEDTGETAPAVRVVIVTADGTLGSGALTTAAVVLLAASDSEAAATTAFLIASAAAASVAAAVAAAAVAPDGCFFAWAAALAVRSASASASDAARAAAAALASLVAAAHVALKATL